MTLEQAIPLIKDMLSKPPNCITYAQVVNMARTISDYEWAKIATDHGWPLDKSKIFDNRDHRLVALNCFAAKQYFLMNDLITLSESYVTEKTEKVFQMFSVWSIGLIASAMQENLLQFAWMSDDYANRSELFYNFFVVQDLEHYKEKDEELKKSLLYNVKRHADAYKKRPLCSDLDYINKSNYFKEWYKNKHLNSLWELAAGIQLDIHYLNRKVDWNEIYQDYSYLCSFKHINSQRHIINELLLTQMEDFRTVMWSGIKSFLLMNQIILKIYNEQSPSTKDMALTNVENKINKFYSSF